MSDSLITLTTDFGQASPYVAALKGVILGVNPRVRILDLTHDIPPQDLRAASFFLMSAIPYFPAGPIHIVVVDPGVGTDRALLFVEAGRHRLLAPDNGCWTELARHLDTPARVIQLSEPSYWRRPVSATFHGRDILAPVAAWLSLNLDPERLGQRTTEWVDLRMPAPAVKPDYLRGEVIFVDRFGNLITNIPAQALADLAGSKLHVSVGNHDISQVARAYGDAPPSTLIALISSGGTLEVAVTNGNAARTLGVSAGERVEVRTTD
jgi:S-adenosyl-L-methionine hydrolase (adenosine-forming)